MDVSQSKRCLLDDTRPCTDCGECTRCDLDPEKLCDNCMKCVKGDAEYRAIRIDSIVTNEGSDAAAHDLSDECD